MLPEIAISTTDTFLKRKQGCVGLKVVKCIHAIPSGILPTNAFYSFPEDFKLIKRLLESDSPISCGKITTTIKTLIRKHLANPRSSDVYESKRAIVYYVAKVRTEHQIQGTILFTKSGEM